MRTTDYSTFLSHTAGLIGIAPASLQLQEKTILNGFFNDCVHSAWERSNWIDLTTIGEARFVGNLIPYPNLYASPGGPWLPLGLTVNDRVLPNPADNRMTAGTIFETVANSTHQLQSAVLTLVQSTSYTASVYVRPMGRTFAILRVTGGPFASATFNLITSTVTATTNCTASVGAMANGFFLLSITFTSGGSPASGTAFLQLTPDGTSTTYGGNPSLGLGLWGFFWGPSSTVPGTAILPWEQSGEAVMEAVFNVWRKPPSSVTYPASIPFTYTADGVQLVGTGAQIGVGNPVFVDYRADSPDFIGSDYSAAATYAVNDQIFYTTTAGAGNYYRCLLATTAGQSPESTPSKWLLLAIPQIFLDFCVNKSYAKWLMLEGRAGAAQLADKRAEDELDEQFDRQERQMGAVLSTKYQTHVSAQAR